MGRMKSFPSTLSGFPDIRYLAHEVHRVDRYFWDNAQRKRSPGWIVQQTLFGSAFYENSVGRQMVGPGRAMLFRHGEDSRYGLDDSCERPYGIRWILIEGEGGVEELFGKMCDQFGPVLRMAEQGEAGQLLRHLQEDFARGIRRDRLYLAEAAYRFLIALYREQVAERSGDDPIAHGRHLLESQFRAPRNLKEWAAEIGVSREHFTREFRQRYGESPAMFLRRLRLEHARLLMGTSHMDLADVAAASGFASAQTFHRAYRRHFGKAAGADRRV